jgi:Retrotransposon gag protein
MPIFFMRERGRVNTFLQTFNYFQNANHQIEVMTSPFQQANLLLTFMQGPKVEQWAARKGEELTLVVLGDLANHVLLTHQENDEAIWNDLLIALRNAYSKYHGVKGAYRAIKDLQQKEGHVNDYIIELKNLLSKAEWRQDQHGTIAMFKEGLIEGLLGTCIRHHPCPVTLTDWKDTVRDEEQSFYQLKFNLAEAKKHRSGRCLEDMAQDASRARSQPMTLTLALMSLCNWMQQRHKG